MLKLYADELGRDEAILAASAVERLVVSVIAQAEIPSAFHRKFREGQWNALEVQAALRQFDLDVSNGFLTFSPLTDAILKKIQDTYQKAPKTIFLRAPDAIHLATAALAGFATISANDRHLLAAAPLFHLRGVNPISEK